MTSPQPGWYDDPTGSFDLRWWDGGRWTPAVVTAGAQTTSPLPDGRGPVRAEHAARGDTKLRGQVRERPGLAPVAGGGGTLFTEPVLVVQKAQLAERTDEHAVLDPSGRRLGSVVRFGQSGLRRAFRHVGSLDRHLSWRLEVQDAQGVPQLRLTRPATVARWRVVVERPGAGEVGQLVQQDAPGRVRLALVAGGRPVGSLDGPDRRARDFSVLDGPGAELAHITRTAETPSATTDHHVVTIHRRLDEPLLSLVVASALTVATALEQDAQGWG